MYQTSEAFARQMDRRPFQVLLTGSEDSLQVDSLEFSAGWCPTSFSLGNANAASFSAECSGEALSFGVGDSVALIAGLSLEDGSLEQVPLGNFTLTKVEREADSNRWSLAGEDAVSTLLAEEYFCTDVANPPDTAPQILAEICDQMGLSLEGEELVPDTPMALEYDAAGGSDCSMRELVGQIALLAGANALMDRTGVLRLCRFNDTDYQVGPQRYYESGLSLETDAFVFGALEVTVSTLQQGDSGTQESQQVFTAQLEGKTRGIRFSSQWFDQAAFDGVWQAWQGKCWQPAQIEFLGDLRLDPGDLIRVADRAGTEYTLAVMGIKHSFDGGFRTTVSCYGPGESGYAQPQTVSQAITGLKTDLGRFRRLYTDNLEATAAQIKHITTEDIVGECGTINLAKGTFEFGDALVWDGSHLTVRGTLESGEGTVGGWGIQSDCFETSYEKDDGSTGWEGYTRLVPASWELGESDAGLLLRAAKTGVSSEQSEGWVTFHRDAGEQWAYKNLKLGSSVLGGAAVSAERYLITSEVVLGQFGYDSYDLDSYGVMISADNGAGVATSLSFSPGGDVKISGGGLMLENLSVGEELQRLGGGFGNKGELSAYRDSGHAVGITYDNTYAVYVDGTSPAIALDGTVIPLMRRSQFDYKTMVNLDNIRAGVYWINGYSATITGTPPWNGAHYLLISSGTNQNTAQVAISLASGHDIKTRYRANGGAWGAWS